MGHTMLSWVRGSTQPAQLGVAVEIAANSRASSPGIGVTPSLGIAGGSPGIAKALKPGAAGEASPGVAGTASSVINATSSVSFDHHHPGSSE